MTGLQPHRHEEVARAFGSGAGQVRRLDIEEVVRLHDSANDGHGLRAGADGLCRSGATQVEVAVAPPRRLVDAAIDRIRSVNRERRRLALAQHLDAGCDDLHLTGWQVGVGVALRPLTHLAVDPDAPLTAQGVRLLGRRTLTADDLHDAAAVPQVDEDDAAVVATPRHPSGERDGRAGVLPAQLARLMRADHDDNLFRSTSTSYSLAIAPGPPSRRSFNWTTPSARSRSPATTAYVAAERSAAFIAPLSPRSP